jgi:hypothetical protein
MRAHEKMLLNSKLMRARPHGRHFDPDEGCALGMIEGPGICGLGYTARSQMAEVQYPWLMYGFEPPCQCIGEHLIPQYRSDNGKPKAKAIIVHLFNEHVMQSCLAYREPWTMERLADYIKSIDPTVDQDEELICEQGVRENVEVKA